MHVRAFGSAEVGRFGDGLLTVMVVGANSRGEIHDERQYVECEDERNGPFKYRSSVGIVLSVKDTKA